MKMNEYQELASRTANTHKEELVNYALGITGEAGEVADLVKKARFHGHSVHKETVTKELGDVLWYLSNLARLAGVSLETVAAANIEKLKKRYPEGFSEEASQNREEYKKGDAK